MTLKERIQEVFDASGDFRTSSRMERALQAALQMALGIVPGFIFLILGLKLSPNSGLQWIAIATLLSFIASLLFPRANSIPYWKSPVYYFQIVLFGISYLIIFKYGISNSMTSLIENWEKFIRGAIWIIIFGLWFVENFFIGFMNWIFYGMWEMLKNFYASDAGQTVMRFILICLAIAIMIYLFSVWS